MLEILKTYWGYNTFRPMQEEIIRSVLSGRDTLALLPTGGGKSICFQVPALSKPGLCLVISPLVALMKDQVANLKKRGIKAIAVYSGMNYTETDNALDNCIYGNYKFLYVSPERLQTPLFIERFKRMTCNLIAVDEAHCISQWGYDFRPPYLQIASIKAYHPHAPLLALTATATAKVIDDIQDKLQFSKRNVLRKSFYRPNLTYTIENTEDKFAALERLIRPVKQSVIVYVRNRKSTHSIAEWLEKKQISATYYHAGLDHATRNTRQEAWLRDEYKVIVATNAFGMGIDKPDVRVVVHMDLPDSLEAYFQEAGRAGRDEQPATAIMLFNQHDLDEQRRFIETQFPSIEEIKKAYMGLCDYLSLAEGSGENSNFEIDLADFSYHFKIPVYTLFHALRILEKEGWLSFTDREEAFSKVHIHKPEVYYNALPSDFDRDLVRMLIRTYEGLFDQFVWIQEEQLARRLNSSTEGIVKHLRMLNRLDVLHYAHKKSGFRIILLKPRAGEKQFSIPSKQYAERKQAAMQHLESVIHYTTQNERCRNSVLLAYFDETRQADCRQCDVCLQHLAATPDTLARIVASLKKQPDELIYLPVLEVAMPEIKSGQYKYLRWLTDNGILSINPLNMVKIDREKLNKLH